MREMLDVFRKLRRRRGFGDMSEMRGDFENVVIRIVGDDVGVVPLLQNQRKPDLRDDTHVVPYTK